MREDCSHPATLDNRDDCPRPRELDDLTYDAWNRLVRIQETVGEQTQTVAEHQYDGRNRRTLKKLYSAGSLDHTQHFYYSARWQVLEERVDNSSDADRQYIWGLRYVDDRILRDRDDQAGGNLGKTGSSCRRLAPSLHDPPPCVLRFTASRLDSIPTTYPLQDRVIEG